MASFAWRSHAAHRRKCWHVSGCCRVD